MNEKWPVGTTRGYQTAGLCADSAVVGEQHRFELGADEDAAAPDFAARACSFSRPVMDGRNGHSEELGDLGSGDHVSCGEAWLGAAVVWDVG